MKIVSESDDCIVTSSEKYVNFTSEISDSKADISYPSENLPFQLQPILPAECDGNVPLGDALIAQLTGRVMRYLHQLCDERGARLDFQYWKNITHRILSLHDSGTLSVVPSQAGSGKSTWILAFILAVSESLLGASELLATLGGILLVVQKVEDLENFVELVRDHFPDSPVPLMVAMQSYSPTARERGLCINPQVQDFRDCSTKSCPYAEECPLLSMMSNARNAPILGMTQARYNILRANGTLPLYLDGGEGSVSRRFLLYDEKPDLFPAAIMSIPIINKASSEIEAADYLSDRTKASLQASLSYVIRRPVNALRRDTQQHHDSMQRDPPYGLCPTIVSEEDYRRFVDFRRMCEERLTHNTPNLRACLDVMARLYNGKALFDKRNSFSITAPTKETIRFDHTLQIVFDATARVDGDYLHLLNAELLPSSPVRSMSHVTLHVYSGGAVNLSKQAFKNKPWLVDGLCDLVAGIIAHYPAPTFLCTYKEQSRPIYKALPDDVKPRLALMPHASEDAPLPYFGGTNGSNAFKHCRNVILLGYPRHTPSDYLRQTFLAWRSAGFLEELQAGSDAMAEQDIHGKHRQIALPSVIEYESRHLASRYIQEIFRCAIRNGEQTDDIHIFLFAPPPAVLALVKSQLPDCVTVEEPLPEEFLRKQTASRSYLGKPTARVKFFEFLTQWDGKPLSITQLRAQLGISPEAWSSLREAEGFNTLCRNSGIIFTGRGKNAKMTPMSDVA